MSLLIHPATPGKFKPRQMKCTSTGERARLPRINYKTLRDSEFSETQRQRVSLNKLCVHQQQTCTDADSYNCANWGLGGRCVKYSHMVPNITLRRCWNLPATRGASKTGDDHKKSRRKLFQDEANETKLNSKCCKEHWREVEYKKKIEMRE